MRGGGGATIPALLDRRRGEDGDVRAIVTPDAAITYRELDDASRDVAARLAAGGVGRGDRVALLAPNGIEWATLAYGIARLGAVLVPLSTLLRAAELEAHLAVAEVTHVIAVREHRGRRYLDDLKGGRPVWATDDLPAPGTAVADEVAPEDDLVVLFTSGSTGTPKGTIHTHGSALGATAASLDARAVRRGERLYLPMPFFWTGGFSQGLIATLLTGATLLTEGRPEPSRTLRFLERERVTLFRGWPDQAAKLATHPSFAATDLSSLGDASLGAVLPPERRPPPGARPNLFGMTETFGPWCGARLDVDLPPGKWGSCGRPFAGVEVRVGPEGELWLRGPNLLRGVCGRPTSDVFTPDGWFRTGDRGRVDDDGYVWFEGRIDDMFKVKGASVYPSEVEAALRGVDGVRQAHVTEVDGEVGALVITDLAPDAVAAAVKSRLSAFKVPTRWRLVPDPSSVPMTVTGKVDKAALRAVLADGARKDLEE